MSGFEELRKLAETITKEKIRKIVLDLLERPVLSFTDTKPLISIEESPAAPRKHHFFKGGLAIHTLSVTKLALAIAGILREVYDVSVETDVVVATAILHDIFKYYQYTTDNIYGGFKAREDWYLGHDYAIVAELALREAPDKLIRAVSEVHGLTPFTTLEGLVVHIADGADAKLGEVIQNMLLSRVKDLEAQQCQVYKAVNSAIEKHGLKRVIELMLNSMNELRRIVEEECRQGV